MITQPSRSALPTAAAAPDRPARDLDDWCPSRRSVMRGLMSIGGVVLVPGLLTACSSGDAAEGTDTGSGAADSSGAAAGGAIAAADVAVGTAVVVKVGDRSYVVAQPAEGDFVAFDAACTHQGTTVGAGDGLTLVCPNHGSEFDASADGAVLTGPATQPLAAVDVTVDGDQLVLG